MKLASMLDHIPVYQTVQLAENLKVIAEGKPNEEKIREFATKTVGLFHAEGDKIEISVYDR